MQSQEFAFRKKVIEHQIGQTQQASKRPDLSVIPKRIGMISCLYAIGH